MLGLPIEFRYSVSYFEILKKQSNTSDYICGLQQGKRRAAEILTVKKKRSFSRQFLFRTSDCQKCGEWNAKWEQKKDDLEFSISN